VDPAKVAAAQQGGALALDQLLAHLEHLRVQTPLPSQNRSSYRRAAEAKIDQELETIERLAIQDGK
jgi:hypothetical protein